MLKLSLSPTVASSVACIFWSKSKNVCRRAERARAGLSVFTVFTPVLIVAVPRERSFTPPGPKIFSRPDFLVLTLRKSNGLLPESS